MLARHLLCGILSGILTAFASLLAGHSGWTALEFYILAGNLGLGASALNAYRDCGSAHGSPVMR